MENRVERVVLETDRYRVEGNLTLPREGFRSRLTDYLNRTDLAFIPLTEVVVSALAGGDPERNHDYLAVAVDHIQLAYPHESSGA